MKFRASFLVRSGIIIAAICISLPGSARAQLNSMVLHSFQGDADGQQPVGALVQAADGAVFGTTFLGGTNNAGTIFKVSPDGSGNSIICHLPQNPVSPFGLADPSGLIQGADGGLYGTIGGGGEGFGSVFRLNPDGTGFTNLYRFSPAEAGGYDPGAALLQGRDGLLYGTTQAGGVYGAGTVFKLVTNGTGFVQLHSFGIAGDGLGPQAPLIEGDDQALYGTTTVGGADATDGTGGYGAVFKINLNGSGHVVLHSFRFAEPESGLNPNGALVQGADGALYGVTQQGGSTYGVTSSGHGTVFRLTPDGTKFKVLHSFNPELGSDGSSPRTGLIIGNNGILYGTTERGGASDRGAVFQINPDGSGYRVLHSLSPKSGGIYPSSPLIAARDGGLLGAAGSGGDASGGTVFRLVPEIATVSLVRSGNGPGMIISLSSAPPLSYRIEASTNFFDWVSLTNVASSNGMTQVADQEADKHQQRFYRAAWTP